MRRDMTYRLRALLAESSLLIEVRRIPTKLCHLDDNSGKTAQSSAIHWQQEHRRTGDSRPSRIARKRRGKSSILRDFACFKDRFGDWSCPVNSVPMNLEKISIPD
jgi:hypothetical protein